MISGAVANVLDYGADPTGVANSSAAFAAAVATGKSVFVPKGRYQTSFDLNSCTEIFGESSRAVSELIPVSGASYVIRINATSSPKVYCQIRNLSIINPNAVSGVTGIYFKGTDVNTINDNHVVSDVFMEALQYGIRVDGRLIASSFIRTLLVSGFEVGFLANVDPVNTAFIGNHFNLFQCLGATKEGFKLVGSNVTNAFINCAFQDCNSNNVAGNAAAYIEDAQMVSFINCYWEFNGAGVAVDTANPRNNSIGLFLGGDICFEPKIENCWMVQSGVMILLDAIAGGVGGGVKGTRFAPNTNGFDVACLSLVPGENSAPFVIDADNYFSGKISIDPGVTARLPACIRQSHTSRYITGNMEIDVRNNNRLTVNSAAGFTFNNITNFFGGEELWIANVGTGTVVVPASYMANGVALSLAANDTAILYAQGFPAAGKFRKMN